MTKNYNDVVSNLREIARDQLRMEAINSLRTELLGANNEMDQINKGIENTKLHIATTEYEISKLDTAHPMHEQTLKHHNLQVELYNLSLTKRNTEKDNQQKNIDKINTNITKVTDGEYKVCREQLETVTNKLIKNVTEASAQKLEVTEITQ